MSGDSFDQLAAVCERVAAAPGRNAKIDFLAEFLAALSESGLRLAIRFLRGRPVEGNGKASVGYAALRDALIEATGWDRELVRLCVREVGDMGETIGLMLTGSTQSMDLTLAEAERQYVRIFAARNAEGKVAALVSCLERYRPETLKYFIKVITGSFRIGLQEKLLEEALAKASGAPAAAFRAAHQKAGDLELVALAARRGELEQVAAQLFHPFEFMLAKPIESAPEIQDAENWLVEDKYDGIRSQIHAAAGEVKIFTRGMEDASASFPELVECFRAVREPVAIDGEILAWKDGRALNFTVLQQRLQRKKVTAETIAAAPVHFIAYDLLFAGGAMWNDIPLEERRAGMIARLEGLDPRIHISEQHPLGSLKELDREFEQARARGNEGLLLKRRGSFYESGRRGGDWLKVKKAFATLDVVITAAEHGHGRRATVLSDYTFAVRDGDRYLNIGKAYSGLTDEEIRQMTRILKGLTTDRFGRVLLVEPQVVLEVAFDGIQQSPRHKSGYALRFPRILNWRRDKTAQEIDTLDEVKALYEASLRA